MLETCRQDITRQTDHMIHDFGEKRADRTYEMQVMKTLTTQLEDVQMLLVNISRDMNKLQDRQTQLEKQFIKQEKQFIKQEKPLNVTSVLLSGTTLSNDIPIHHGSGPVTRSKSKLLRDTTLGNATMTKVHKPSSFASRTTARTIIPWDELTMPEAECTTTYPSEL